MLILRVPGGTREQPCRSRVERVSDVRKEKYGELSFRRDKSKVNNDPAVRFPWG